MLLKLLEENGIEAPAPVSDDGESSGVSSTDGSESEPESESESEPQPEPEPESRVGESSPGASTQQRHEVPSTSSQPQPNCR